MLEGICDLLVSSTFNELHEQRPYPCNISINDIFNIFISSLSINSLRKQIMKIFLFLKKKKKFPPELPLSFSYFIVTQRVFPCLLD